MKKSIITFALCLWAMVGFSQNLAGTWNGNLVASATRKIVFVFKFEKQADGYKTTISIPTKRVTLNPQKTTFSEGKLLVDGSNIGIKYEGVYQATTQQIEGKLSEGAASYPLNLKAGAVKVTHKAKRPQEPVKPYPYRSEEVTFANAAHKITLAGTLTLPQKGDKFPVVVLITGSGPQDRDETFSGHKPFLVLADYLTKQGIAVLRYDDRGVGKSTGNYTQATSKDLATDVASAVAYLKTRADIDPKKIGLAGHSEGGIIAPLVANQLKKDVAFMVLLAGTGTSGLEVNVMQAKEFRPFKVNDEAKYEKAVRKAFELASAKGDIKEVRKKLKAYYVDNLGVIFPPLLGASPMQANQVIDQVVKKATSRWSRFFNSYNPADEIAKVSCPVLSINGSKDTQVPAKVHQAGIRQALIKGKNKDFKVVELPGLNHLFQECETGKMNEYSKIEQTFAPEAMKLVGDWILANVGT
jgi:pimeloyl-ACP methyl ester carboxylesterase